MAKHEITSLAPGSLAPRSGLYEQIGPHGRTGTQIKVHVGHPLPQTIDPASGWELVTSSEERRAPEMQVITKGWWTLREERAPVEELEQEDRDEQRQA